MGKDKYFSDEIKKAADFKFGKNVVTVFDDMVNRSVPFYEEIQRMIGELAGSHALPGTKVYDLGCSTGASLWQMHNNVNDLSIPFVGIDNSEEMLKKCRSKMDEAGVNREILLECKDIDKNLDFENASVIVSCLTIQFVRPVHREAVLRKIYEGLVPGGVFIFVEKILAEESSYNRDYIEYYYNMKRRHNYSELEISQKREALENVLIPYKLSENLLLLKEAGFNHTEVFFKWYNFCGMIAEKSAV